MALEEDLQTEVETVFKEAWTTRDGKVVPEPSDLKLSNDAVVFDRATFLYADLSGSTRMVNQKSWQFSGEIYKTFLICAAKIIKSEGGVITSYDGDRVMGIFIGESQTTPAARCGLKINYAVQKILMPALKAQYPKSEFIVKQVVGIDTGPVKAVRIGVRGGNDLVWVGRPANYAAKLTELNLNERTWVTKEAYHFMREEVKIGGKEKSSMWKRYKWSQENDHEIYGSTWWWKV